MVHRLSVTGYLYLDSQKPTDANVPSGYIASSISGTIYPSSVVVVGAEMTFSNLNIPGDTKYVYVKCYSDEDELNYIEMDHRNNGVSCASAQRYCSLTYNINCQGGAGTLPTQQSIIYGGTIDVDTLSILTRDGYSFSGWSRNAEATYPEFLKKDTS